VVEVESRMSEYEDKRRRIKYSVYDRIPERALFFLDVGSDLGIMGRRRHEQEKILNYDG